MSPPTNQPRKLRTDSGAPRGYTPKVWAELVQRIRERYFSLARARRRLDVLRVACIEVEAEMVEEGKLEEVKSDGNAGAYRRLFNKKAHRGSTEFVSEYWQEGWREQAEQLIQIDRPARNSSARPAHKPANGPQINADNAVNSLINARLPMMLSPVRAGAPSWASDDVDRWVTLEEVAGVVADSTMLVQAVGASMRYDNIEDGDLLVVQRTGDISPGRVIIASLSGDVTVKRLERIDGNLWLLPANAEFAPFMITPEMGFRQIGVVTSVLHIL